VGKIFSVFENVLNAGGIFIFRGIGGLRLSVWLDGSGARIMLFCLIAVVSFIALFGLRYQDVELDLQISKQFAQFVIAMDGLLQLSLQIFNELGEALILVNSFEVFLFPWRRVVIHGAPPLRRSLGLLARTDFGGLS
jgi:hypothetical protein